MRDPGARIISISLRLVEQMGVVDGHALAQFCTCSRVPPHKCLGNCSSRVRDLCQSSDKRFRLLRFWHDCKEVRTHLFSGYPVEEGAEGDDKTQRAASVTVIGAPLKSFGYD